MKVVKLNVGITEKLDIKLIDFLRFFLDKKSANLAKYMYPLRPELFNNLLEENKSYYIFSEEIAALRKLIDKNYLNFGDKELSVFEFGPGSKVSLEYKTIPLIGYLSSKAILNYKAIDICAKYAEEASEYVGTKTGVANNWYQQDFMTDPIILPINNKQKIIMFLGGNFCNLTLYEINLLFAKWSRFLSKGDKIITTVDSTKDIRKLEKAYNHKINYELGYSSLEYFKNVYNVTNFDIQLLKPFYEYDSQQNSIHISFVALESQEFSVNGYRIKIEKNRVYRALSSRKYEFEHIISIAETHNLKIDKIINENNSEVRTLVLSKL